MRLRTHFWLAAACFVPALGQAQDQSGFGYTAVELSFIDVEFDVGPFNVDGDGFAIGGTFTITEGFFVGGSYEDIDFDFGVDGEIIEIGGGYFHPLNEDLDFVATLDYVETEASAGNQSVDDDGLALGGGIRAALGTDFEVDAILRYVNMDLGDSDTGIELRGRYYFNDEIAVWAQTDFGNDIDTLSIGIRWEF
jgi:hypothetical protein